MAMKFVNKIANKEKMRAILAEMEVDIKITEQEPEASAANKIVMEPSENMVSYKESMQEMYRDILV